MDPTPSVSPAGAEQAERERQRRHEELIDKHVRGDPQRRAIGGKAAWVRYASASSVGIEMAVAIVLCTLAARWLESNYTHWSPWTTLIGFAVGIGAAIKAIVRAIRQYERELAALDAREAANVTELPSEHVTDRPTDQTRG